MNCIIKHAINRHHFIGYKFGIPLPSSMANVEQLYQINGKMLWMEGDEGSLDCF